MLVKYHADMSHPTEHSSIFVFGSNLAGRHGAGSARAAFEMYGAELGVGIGPTGQSYAIPTVDTTIFQLPIEIIELYVDRFIRYANQNQTVPFFMTRIGCGIAGFSDEQIAGLFIKAVKYDISNIDYPEEWKPFLS